MRTVLDVMKRALALCLCACLLLSAWPAPALAQDATGGTGANGAGGNGQPEQKHKRAIVISAEQPNVWTLEQAHYLLAQMHRRNLDLKATGLGELDPNEINGLNFEVLRTLLEVGVTFDEAARFNNSLLRRDRRFDADRAIRLQTRRDQLADESLALNRDIARLGRERALAASQEEKDALAAQIAELTAVRDANDKEVGRLDNDLKTATGPAGDVQATEPPPATGADKLPKSDFDDAFKSATKSLIERFNEAPKLNATLRLDNFLQMQYEIIAKQLTLLRDEVGPGQRIVFLELPQTVNASYGKADRKWAQSWWKIVGYTTTPPAPASALAVSIRDANGNGKVGEGNSGVGEASFTVRLSVPSKERVTVNYRTENGTATVGEDYVNAAGTVTFQPNETTQTIKVQVRGDTAVEGDETFLVVLSDAAGAPIADGSARAVIVNDDRAQTSTQAADGQEQTSQAPQQTQFETFTINKGGREVAFEVMADDKARADSGRPGTGARFSEQESRPNRTTSQIISDAIAAVTGDKFHKLDPASAGGPENPAVRTIELIPRQGSLNVNDIKLQVRSGVLNVIAKTLFGLGARLNYQRQRESFSQFVQQELYSSAFGKGSREFGWTFTPMPGTDRVLSGVRTTYAVLVVPEEAETLVLKTAGCYFPRSEYQPNNFADTGAKRWRDTDRQSRNCSEQRMFVAPIPGGGGGADNDFWVEGLEYNPVRKGERVVLSIFGRNFSSQTGVLVDGVPLTQAIGLAQPLIRDDSVTGEATARDLKDVNVRGRIERVDSNQIIAVFERLDGKEGTPVITLTSPGKARNLNTLKLRVNGERSTTLAAAPYMFGKKADEKDPFRIDRVEIFRARPPADAKTPATLTAVIRGAGFKDAKTHTLKTVVVNGVPLQAKADSIVSPTLMKVDFAVPSDELIRVALVFEPKAGEGGTAAPRPETKTVESEPVANPARLRIGDVSVVSYEAATDKEPATLVVRIEGSGFSDDLVAYVEDVLYPVVVKSSTEALLKIENPKAAALVILKDKQTGLQTKTIVTRKRGPQE